MQVSLGISFTLVMLLFGLTDFILESRHFFHLDVAFGSLAQLVHVTGWFLHRLFANLLGRKARSMECNATLGLRFWIWTAVRPNLSMNFLRDLLSACR